MERLGRKHLGVLWGAILTPFWHFFFKQKTAYEIGVRLVGSEMCIRDSARPLQEASMRPRRSKKGPGGLWGAILTPPRDPQDLKNNSLGHEILMLPRSPGSLPGALCKTSKSIPRYSKTRLCGQEHCKIFQDKPFKHFSLRAQAEKPPGPHTSTCRSRPQRVGGGATPHGILG